MVSISGGSSDDAPPHQPEGVGREDGGDNNNPHKVGRGNEDPAGGKGPADIHEVVERREEGYLGNERRQAVEREEDP